MRWLGIFSLFVLFILFLLFLTVIFYMLGRMKLFTKVGHFILNITKSFENEKEDK